MKFGGKPLARHTCSVATIVRHKETYTLTVAPLSPGWMSRLRQMGLLTFPRAPKRPVMNGSRPLKGPDGVIVMAPDEADPEYVKEMLTFTRRYKALQIAEMLRLDTNFSFDAQAPEGRNVEEWEAYADAIAAEIEDPVSGFTDEEVERLFSALEKTGTELDLDGAVDQYLGEA